MGSAISLIHTELCQRRAPLTGALWPETASGQHRHPLLRAPARPDHDAGTFESSPLVGSVRDIEPLSVEPVCEPAERLLFRELVGRYHYLGYTVPFGARLRYLVFASRPQRVVVGCLQFSSSAWRMAARDGWVGWDDATRARNLQHVVGVRNLAGAVLSRGLGHLMVDWPGDKTKKGKKGKTPAVRPRPVAKRGVGEPRTRARGGDRQKARMLEAERHDPARVKRWGVLVDGAETQLDLVEAGAAEFGVEVTVVLDIIHVVEYVWKAAHVFHRDGSPELACWAWTRVRDILEGKASRVASSMRRAATVAGLSSDTRKPVDTCADYLLKYAPYLQYDRYLSAGYPIATGVVEGACRHLVRDRMELTGARWRLVGAEAVLKLRALRASGECVPDLPRSDFFDA